MKTFSVQTLGCKVNQYEGEQIATLLRSRGLTETDPARAELRIVNTCSVTVQAGSKSRQTARRNVRLPLLLPGNAPAGDRDQGWEHAGESAGCVPANGARGRVVLTGCWATSDRSAAAGLRGVDAVITHGDDVAAELDRLLHLWRPGEDASGASPAEPHAAPNVAPQNSPNPARDDADEWMDRAGREAGERTAGSKSIPAGEVNVNHDGPQGRTSENRGARVGTAALPLLGAHQTGRQRALLKVQDGCDAHCTYCIIPKLRPGVWSKPVDDAVREARSLVASGHVELVLTGIFLGAYGQPTALRRRQPAISPAPLGRLVEALCTSVTGLRRVRLSSLEPGDLTDDLLAVLRRHPQVVPHFHLPLQSGSDALLRRMNRQYGRDDFLRMIDQVRAAFDRPALTTDVIVGFPGETDEAFERTADVVDRAGFIHVHAFPFSPRPGTAAARWNVDFVHGPVVNERIDRLREQAAAHSLAFRQSFVGREVELLVERDEEIAASAGRETRDVRHGRCERWFDVHFECGRAVPGDLVRVRVDRVTATRTHGTRIDPVAGGGGRP